MTTVPRIQDRLEPDIILGAAVGILLLAPDKWIRRRVESIAFVDANSLQRRVSIDFEPPTAELTGVEGLPIMPLALLEKRVLVNFDARDGDGSPVPVLTRSENSYVAWCILARAAEYEVQEHLGPDAELDPDIINDLRAIVFLDKDDALAALDDFESDAADSDQRGILAESDFFINLASDLAIQFLLLVPTSGRAAERGIIKFSYAQPLERRRGKALARLAGKMGWRPAAFDFAVAGVGQGESYHIEFTVPTGLRASASELVVFLPATHEIPSGEELEDPENRFSRPGVSAGNRVHAYTSRRPARADAIFSVWLQPEKTGLLRASVATAFLTTLVLAFFLIDSRLESMSGDSATAILLVVPGLIAAFIVRPGEHRLVSDLVLGVRAQVVLAGLSAYGAALAIVARFEASELRKWWLLLAAIAGMCLISLCVSYVGLKPRGLAEDAYPNEEERG